MSITFKVAREASVTSTNDVAKRRGMNGDPEGTVIIAKAQTSGRGRSGNAWSSPPGGLYMSVLLRPDLGTDEVLRMTVFSSVPVAKAIEKVAGIEIGLKWPNDIESHGSKIGGILVEGVTRSGRFDFVVVGIGVNANLMPAKDAAPNATSLRQALGREVDVEELAMAVLDEFGTFYEDLASGALRRDYISRSTVLGRKVELIGEQGSFEAIAKGIGADGSLLLRGHDGEEIEVSSATGVSLRLSGRRGGA